MQRNENELDELGMKVVRTMLYHKAQGWNEALEWAAGWIETSLKGETNERTIEFGKNMAMSLRAGKRQASGQT